MKRVPSSQVVAITEGALKGIVSEAARSFDGLETGGILLGTDTDDGIVIRHAGDAGPGAQRGKGTFRRDLDHARRLAESAWEKDGSQWIGEWHTHPDGGVALSEFDFDSYLRHLNDPELRFERFLSVIASFEAGAGIVVATWIVEEGHARPATLMQQIGHSLSDGTIPIEAVMRADAETHKGEVRT